MPTLSQRTPTNQTSSKSFTLTRDEQPITILLVDDDPDCRMLIRDAITSCKVSNSIVEAENGKEALEFLKRPESPRPGIIFLDIEMPGMDGQTALRAGW